ncbi:hypothetical protein A2W54_04580 [Candidatus Giovannonibacteria bacterium RIFCSPHIGHO2_02_43_13]|uniref:Uncharacterized protein n=1 Tax=Candidatus Giovannonibacteria bacterium RIFCSPHIGHO2_02_43_13 TaxID=1798330 RepID=A0A1F5WRZ9_9BACT|nr:MAG: hypothetical protein UW28_C0011G0002 [Parcubacteria group bacterium GW2011_GWA2_44_13]OGF78442.1 MAG: hypothetical protein A2W54_04580 [Candidatus Giovannonibacteria bacterium RIFCSPHIGHO2_02_43_13]OGF88658.1 MAG: hypothetical protein A3I94_04075 [Candidatus Giovannonibacteria bacterium RIFCSPLOWO2_02_FULL_43_54]OGF97573.1 MAG: hypothetical protein A3H08_00520 [Candidatus Giovannonibacteria bacterium RIFCSPLOWO2_12_FULL_44_32]
MGFVFIVAGLIGLAVALYWPRPFDVSGETRNRMTQKDFDELVEKLLRCPMMYKGLVFTEVKHVQPFLKEEIEEVLRQYIDIV